MPIQKSPTWLEFIDQRRNQDHTPNIFSFDGFESLLGLTSNIHPLIQHSVPCIYLLDYSTGMYKIFTDNAFSTIGIKKDYFESGGVDFTVSRYHKDDLRLYNEQIFPDRVSFLEKIKPEDHPNYVFSYNYRFKNHQGKYCSLLQRNTFIKSDANGKPLLSLGMVINVEHYKNPNTSIQLIERINGSDHNTGSETISKMTYFLNQEDCQLTAREKEFIKYLAEGLSSRQIAEKLFLSEHTVKVHRKNMLLKTNTSNVAELIAWAMKKEIF